jgi:hypothetical protein
VFILFTLLFSTLIQLNCFSILLNVLALLTDQSNICLIFFVPIKSINTKLLPVFQSRLSIIPVDKNDRNTGNNLVFIDLIGTKNIKQIFDWSVNKASTFNNIEKQFNWIRVENNKVKRINTKQIR